MPSLSPDGTQVVYVTREVLSGTSTLYVLAIDTGARLRLTSNVGIHVFPRWSPDGKWIAFVRRDQGLFLISPLGGPERKLLDPTQFSDYCWSADARRLIFSSNPSSPTLQTVDVQNGTMQHIAELPHLQTVAPARRGPRGFSGWRTHRNRRERIRSRVTRVL